MPLSEKDILSFKKFNIRLQISLDAIDDKILSQMLGVKPNYTARSVIQKPTVFVDDVLNTLSVKFTSQGEIYNITITDETGFPITQFQTVSDYAKQVYSIPALKEGLYTVTIEGSSNSFTGSFNI